MSRSDRRRSDGGPGSHALRAPAKWVREVLLEWWDPIGGVPPDEYDSYIPGIIRKLADSDVVGLADHLLELERSALCMPAPSADRARRTAEVLFDGRDGTGHGF